MFVKKMAEGPKAEPTHLALARNTPRTNTGRTTQRATSRARDVSNQHNAMVAPE